MKSAFVALIKKNSEVPSKSNFRRRIDKNNLHIKLHAKKVFHYCKIVFFLYIMAPLFAIYSATFFRHEIDCEQPLIFSSSDLMRGVHACMGITRFVPHPSRALSHAHGHLWSCVNLLVLLVRAIRKRSFILVKM